MKNLFKFFTREVIVHKPFPVPEYIVFSVDNFNKWFNDRNNGATYAHSGIFLRTDKLDESHVVEYMEKCYGITNCGAFMWSKPSATMVNEFYYEIRKNWLKR